MTVNWIHSLTIALADKINEKDQVADTICIFGTGEGTKPAIEVARILSKVCAQTSIYVEYWFIYPV